MSTNYRIVVGVDGSDGGRRALRWAVREAAQRDGTIQAVITWSWDDGVETAPPVSTNAEEEKTRVGTLLAQEIEALPAHQRGGVPIASEVVEGAPAEALTAAARDADLLVLGSHGHSRVWHTVLGSVSEACIGKATCPVVVIPVAEFDR